MCQSDSVSASQISSQDSSPGVQSGPDFSAQDGVGIATSLLPLVALFSGGSGKKSKSKSVARRPVVNVQPVQDSTKNNIVLIGGVVVVAVFVVAVVMSRK